MDGNDKVKCLFSVNNCWKNDLNFRQICDMNVMHHTYLLCKDINGDGELFALSSTYNTYIRSNFIGNKNCLGVSKLHHMWCV